MTSTPRARDRYRAAVTVLTGVTSAAALTSTAWIASGAASQYAAEQADLAAAEQSAEAAQLEYDAALAAYQKRLEYSNNGPQKLLRPASPITPKPAKAPSRLALRYVPAPTQVGAGGTVSKPRAETKAKQRTNGGGGSASSGGGSTTTPPPPPPPPPPQSSGS